MTPWITVTALNGEMPAMSEKLFLGKSSPGNPPCAVATLICMVFQAGLILILIAIVAFDLTTRPGPTIPYPGAVPENQSTLHLAPARVIPETKEIRVRLVDYNRFVAALKKDILAHGGWTEDPGYTRSWEISAVVPEAYLERISPLLQAEEPGVLHPNYASWAKTAIAEQQNLVDSPPVKVTFWVYKDTQIFARKGLLDLFKWTLILFLLISTLPLIMMAKSKSQDLIRNPGGA